MNTTTRIMELFALLMMVVGAVGDGPTAQADLLRFPPAEQWRYRYVSSAPLDSEEARETADIALRLVLPSCSRQTVLDHCLPEKIAPTLYRIDLLNLGWSRENWLALVDNYPYSPTQSKDSIVVRTDWFVLNITDQHENDAYYRLVFGTVPKTRDEALKILGVDSTVSHRFGLVEGDSQVRARPGPRWIENRPISRGYAYGTLDAIRLDAQHDPIESPLGPPKHDGEEWIIGLPKVHLATGTRGALQVYFLANGQGGIVDRAPVDLVEDDTEFRGYREIRDPGSCISCHKQGLNYPTRNELREILKSGVELKAYYAEQQRIEAFHLSDIGKELKRNNEDFCAIVQLACGVEAPVAVARYQACVSRYDEVVTLERAACELYTTPEELKLALAWHSAGNYAVGARGAALAHGGTMPREGFEENYYALRTLVDQWRLRQ